LLKWQTTQIPDYDSQTSNRKEQLKTIKPEAVILVEGTLVLDNPAIREKSDCRIFLDTDTDIRLSVRSSQHHQGVAESSFIVQKKLQQGHKLPDILDKYLKIVKPAHDKWCEPVFLALFSTFLNLLSVKEICRHHHSKLLW
jgi:uridine kinase